jgi:hypothetical protein
VGRKCDGRLFSRQDNIRSFLQACEQFGLKGSQLFSITDLQESSPTESNRNVGEGDRRMRNVVLTIYWLGKAASNMPSYAGPELNISAFAGLVGTKETHSLFDGIETKHLTKKTSIKRQDQGVNMRNKEGPEESGTEQAKDGSEKFRDLTVRITKIRRQESGFGLTVAGGKEDGILPFIDGIKPGSSASLSNLQMGDEIHWINGQTIVGATKQKLLTHIAKGDKIGSLLLKIRRYSKRLRTSSYSSDDLPPSVEENQVKSGLSKQVGVADDDKGVVAFNVDVSSEQGAGDDSQIQERERNGKRKMFVLIWHCVCVCLVVCLSVCLSVCLFGCLSVLLSVCLPVCLVVCLPGCLSVYLVVCPSVCPFVCFSMFCLPTYIDCHFLVARFYS